MKGLLLAGVSFATLANLTKRTYAGFWFDMRRTGIFTLCAVLAPQVAASYGVRLSAIPEAYRGTWVPTAEICQDADKSGIVPFGQGVCHLSGELVAPHFDQVSGAEERSPRVELNQIKDIRACSIFSDPLG